jgi:uncharacterized protein YaiL (DUF2058 family)
MTDSIRNQLLGLGFKPAPKSERSPERKTAPKPSLRHDNKPRRPDGERQPGGGRGQAKPDQRKAGGPPRARTDQRAPRTREEIDLAKAYAIRAQREKDERIAAEQAKQEEARKRREARARLSGLVKDKALNAGDAEIARHFPYGGKIKRIYVTESQLKALNAGELGVLQLDGRYVLVSAELIAQAEVIFPAAIALKVDPNAPAEEDPYADPQYQVPDDLVW